MPAPPKITTQLSAVYCELASFDYDIDILIDELRAVTNSGEATRCRSVQRLQLALADAYLMKAVKSQALSESRSIRHARQILEGLATDVPELDKLQKLGKINRFRMLARLAIVEHLITRAPSP